MTIRVTPEEYRRYYMARIASRQCKAALVAAHVEHGRVVEAMQRRMLPGGVVRDLHATPAWSALLDRRGEAIERAEVELWAAEERRYALIEPESGAASRGFRKMPR